MMTFTRYVNFFRALFFKPHPVLYRLSFPLPGNRCISQKSLFNVAPPDYTMDHGQVGHGQKNRMGHISSALID